MLEQIENEIRSYKERRIPIAPGFDFNAKDTIDTIYHYFYSNFESGEKDSEDFKKYFYNIVRNPCQVERKAIDFDTKDINVKTAGGGNPWVTWFFERDLKLWLKKTRFGLLLNQIFEDLPKFGTSVLKFVDGKPYRVDIRNLMVEQDADSIEEANYVIEKHTYSLLGFRKAAEEHNWENVEELLDKASPDSYIDVYERYGLDEDADYSRHIVGTIKEKQTRGYFTEIMPAKKSEILDETKLKMDECPYRDIHREKIPGRWLGVGLVEVLKDNQIRMNELTNLKVKASYWATKMLYQTRDEGVVRNLLTDTKNGDVLSINSEVMRVPTEERNLHAYNQEEQRWLQNRDEVSFSYDVTRGERLPAGTPLGSAQLAAAQSGAYFDVIRENIAGRIKEILWEDIIPSFEKQATKEHHVRLVGEDLNEYHKLMESVRGRKRLIRHIGDAKKWPTSDQYRFLKAVRNELARKEENVEIPKDYYKDLEYQIDIVITGESRDDRMKYGAQVSLLQLIGSNPQVLEDPRTRKIVYKLAEQAGVPAAELAQSQPAGIQQAASQLRMGGGGVSRPPEVETPMRGESTKTI